MQLIMTILRICMVNIYNLKIIKNYDPRDQLKSLAGVSCTQKFINYYPNFIIQYLFHNISINFF